MEILKGSGQPALGFLIGSGERHPIFEVCEICDKPSETEKYWVAVEGTGQEATHNLCSFCGEGYELDDDNDEDESNG